MFETRSVITIPIGKKLPAKRGEKGEREKEVHTRDLRNALDIGPTKNGQMWWESKRGKCQLLEVIDRRSIRLQISHSLSDFFYIPFTLYSLLEGPWRRYDSTRELYFLINGLHEGSRSWVFDDSSDGGKKRKGRGSVIMTCSLNSDAMLNVLLEISGGPRPSTSELN